MHSNSRSDSIGIGPWKTRHAETSLNSYRLPADGSSGSAFTSFNQLEMPLAYVRVRTSNESMSTNTRAGQLQM